MNILQTLLLLYLLLNLLHALWILALWLRTNRTRPPAHARPYTLGQGPTAILLIHGFADLPAAWRRVAARLAELGFTARAMSLPQTRKETTRTWLTAIETEIDALRRSHARVWLLGHSLGGTLALLAAHRAPQKIDGLALWAPYLAIHPRKDRQLPCFRARTWLGIQRFLLLLPLSDTYFPFRRGEPPFDYTVGKVIPRPLFGALFEAARQARALTRHPDLPLFLLLAGDDTVVDNAPSEALLDAWPGPQCRLIEPHAKHPLPLAETWQRQADATARFIATQTERTPPCPSTPPSSTSAATSPPPTRP